MYKLLTSSITNLLNWYRLGPTHGREYMSTGVHLREMYVLSSYEDNLLTGNMILLDILERVTVL